jgi:hypothetical protein
MTSIRRARAIVLRLINFLRRGTLDRELAAEMASHLHRPVIVFRALRELRGFRC